jgi:glycerate kinase
MTLLSAPNAFKRALSSVQAARAIARGWTDGRPESRTIELPVGDGGDGTLLALCHVLPMDRRTTPTIDPLGRRIDATWAFFPGGETGYIEMAEASGLKRLEEGELDAVGATSLGTGRLVRAALDEGVQEVLIGTGGSATTDGGIGALHALGVEFLDEKGRHVEPEARNLGRIASIRIEPGLRALGRARIQVLVDVQNPLLGAEGAARTYGPQKGAASEDVRFLERGLEHLADLIRRTTGREIGSIEGGGAAGGLPAGFHGLLGARIANGAETVLDLLDFDGRLIGADLVVTGEGRLDRQSLYGKAPVAVARRAKSHGIPTVALVGSFDERFLDRFRESGIREIVRIGNGRSLIESIRSTERDLRGAAFDLARRKAPF